MSDDIVAFILLKGLLYCNLSSNNRRLVSLVNCAVLNYRRFSDSEERSSNYEVQNR